MVRFEWDESKAKSNARKHGVRFEEAIKIFAGPYALVEHDMIAWRATNSDGELSGWSAALSYSSWLTR
jgi:uncharacterized DUF497 family protein